MRPPRDADGADADDADALRDTTVAMRSERVTVTFLRNVVWIRSTLVVRAAEAQVTGWPMGMSDHQSSFAGRPIFALEVSAEGEALPITYRTIPSWSSVPEARPGYDGWFEWRVDVRADRDTRVDIAYVVAAHWVAAGARGEPTYGRDIRHGLVQPFAYDLALGQRYRNGRARSRLTASTAGYPARFRRALDGAARMEDLGGRTSIALNEDDDRLQLFLAWPSRDPPPRASRPGGDVPAWLALLDRWLCAFPFAPESGRASAPQLAADDFAAMVEELRERAEHAGGREREVARGLLAALRARLADAIAQPSEGYDRPFDDEPRLPLEDTGALPAPNQIGRLGGRLEDTDWLDAIQAARAWLLPRGEALEPLTREQSLVPPREMDGRDEASVLDDRNALLREDERRTREPTERARPTSLYRDARELGMRAGPPFGLPNQLLVASGRRELNAWWAMLALPPLGLGAFLFLRYRRARQRAPRPDR